MAGLKFRVLLDEKGNEEVFRDILIDENDTFESLYKCILDSVGFQQEQMASFYMSNDNWDKGFEITYMDMGFDDDPDLIQPAIMGKTKLKDFVKNDDQKMILVHDFLRMWIFLIELIDVTDKTPENPKVLVSVGKAPKEDSKSVERDDLQFQTDSDLDEDYDEFGFNEFEDGYDEFDL